MTEGKDRRASEGAAKLVAPPARVRFLRELRDRAAPLSAADLAGMEGITLDNAIYHVRVLESGGVVEVVDRVARGGRTVALYALSPGDLLADVMRRLDEESGPPGSAPGQPPGA
jgi:hypothetical protein